MVYKFVKNMNKDLLRIKGRRYLNKIVVHRVDLGGIRTIGYILYNKFTKESKEITP